eukprot:Gb_20543 [translate_table: standard]
MVTELHPLGHLNAVIGGSAMDKSTHVLSQNQVMTDEQMETLRRQICVYSTICRQLVEMHKAMSQQQQSCVPSFLTGQYVLYDLAAVTPGFRTPGRQRWTPSQTQLQILESLFERGNSTPNKQKIKEITIELSQHGQISETNVYNWFQNRKARAKRKQLLPQKEAESEIETDDDSPKEKKWKAQSDSNPENLESGQLKANVQGTEKKLGMVQQRPQTADEQKFEIQDNSSSSFLPPEAETKANASLDRTRHAVGPNTGPDFIQSLSANKPLYSTNTVSSPDHCITQATVHPSGTITVLLDGKLWEVSCGVVDVRRMLGDDAVLMDSQGHMVPTNDTGVTFHPLHASERYSVLRFS